MTSIKEYIDILINKYNLKKLYYKFIIFSVINSIFKESYYWALIYFSTIIADDPNKIANLGIILLVLLFINIPIEKYASCIKFDFIKEIKIANNKYFMDKIINTSKSNLIGIDMEEYYNIISRLNEYIDKYITNIKIKAELPSRFMTILIVFLTKFSMSSKDNTTKLEITVILALVVIFTVVLLIINRKHLFLQNKLEEENNKYEANIRNYVINSKDLLINNNFNDNYVVKQRDIYHDKLRDIDSLHNSFNTYKNTIVFTVVLILILSYFDKLNTTNFLPYFITMYDIETVVRQLDEYYQNKFSYNKVEIKLTRLFDLFKKEQTQSINNNSINNDDDTCIDKIIIKEINNNIPFLHCDEEIVINMNDHVLIEGVSGCGKTSVFYFLKGIINIDNYVIEPDIETINKKCFITLPNNKKLYSGRLYDIISNYSEEPNIDLINESLLLANMNKYIDNESPEELFITIETISAGEYTRLLIARTIYTIKLKNYDILLFDELDTNLNDDMAILLCKTLLNTFSNNIILYITHNNNVKELFNKTIFIKSGYMKYVAK